MVRLIIEKISKEMLVLSNTLELLNIKETCRIILDPKLEEYTLFSNKTAIILRIDCMLGAQNTSYKYKKYMNLTQL